MQSTILTDEEVAARVQRGEAEAFGELVARYAAKMQRYARKFLFGYEDAEDQVQEVFLKAYANIQSFDASRRFSPWLYRIAHNEFINAIRKKGREPLVTLDTDTLFPHPLSKEEPKRDAEVADMRRVLERSLERIDPKYREPLVLYYFEEFDYREIADILHLPVSTVGVRLKRGREALKKTMGKNGETYA